MSSVLSNPEAPEDLDDGSDPLVSVEDYLEREAAALNSRHEYVAGRIYAMTGVSDRHNLIVGNLFALLHGRLRRGGDCRLFMSDMKLRLRQDDSDCFYYPDLMVCRDPSDRARYWREHPCLIVEVLSALTERVDTREKLWAYRRLEGLGAYLILAQTRPQARLFHPGGSLAGELHEGPQATIELPCGLGAVRLAEVYEGVPA